MELRAIQLLTRDEVKRVFAKYLRLEKPDLVALFKNPVGIAAMDLTVISILIRAIDEGDQARFNFLIENAAGKLKDEISIDVQIQALSDAELITLSKDAIKVLEAGKD